jgi:MFS family permease
MEGQVLAVTDYDFSRFLHVTAVMIGFGATWAEAVFFPVAARMSPRHLPYVHRLQLTINQFLAAPAIVIVAATGVYQVTEGNWEWGDLWVSGTIAILVVIALILIGFFIPSDRKLLPMIEKEIADLGDGEIQLSQLSPEYVRLGRLQGLVGTLTGILLIVAVYFMTTKPGL